LYDYIKVKERKVKSNQGAEGKWSTEKKSESRYSLGLLEERVRKV
jgi:hypothetical protein